MTSSHLFSLALPLPSMAFTLPLYHTYFYLYIFFSAFPVPISFLDLGVHYDTLYANVYRWMCVAYMYRYVYKHAHAYAYAECLCSLTTCRVEIIELSVIIVVDILSSYSCVAFGADVAKEDSGNYTCEIRGPQSVLLGQVTHQIFVRGIHNCVCL